jgi:aminobenzoyl-glutamate utilization protein B
MISQPKHEKLSFSRLPDVQEKRIVSETRNAMRALWERPERPLEEFESSRLLGRWLCDNGFELEYGVGGLPTAFVARWGRCGHVITFLAEYDALPGLGNDCVPYRNALNMQIGHACGHCLLGPANVSAALRVREWLIMTGTAGQVVVIGCPAEELLWGKVALLDRGIFDGADVILTSHADYKNGVPNRPCQSSYHGEWVFEGRAGHAGRDGVGNALAAVERMIQAVGWEANPAFRNIRTSHTIRIGGIAPNIVPDRAAVWWWFRGGSLREVEEAYAAAEEAAAEAARITRTSQQSTLISACRGYLPNTTLSTVLHRAFTELGAPPWRDSDIAWMKQLSTAASPDQSFNLDREVHLLQGGMDPYAQDDGEASWRIPLGRVNWAMPEGVPLHHWSTTALSGHPSGEVGALHCAEVLALAAMRLFDDPARIIAAKDELEEKVKADSPFNSLKYTKNRCFFERPEDFWNGTWLST